MITILTGRQTDPLQEKILDQAVSTYLKHPEQETFIIVPNHIKFTTEVNAINKVATAQGEAEATVKNLQILSFSRLAWFFLKDSQNKIPTVLDDAAAMMLLSQIINSHKDELLLFKNNHINNGLLKQLYQTLLDIKAGGTDLDEITQKELDQETTNKIHDLKIISNAFEKAIAEKFATKDEVQLQLNDYLSRIDNLKNTNFFFTGFSHFSLQESTTIKLLSQKANNLTLSFQTKSGAINKNAEAGDYDYIVQQTIRNLTSYFVSRNLTYHVKREAVKANPDMRELTNNIWAGNITGKNINLDNFIQLVQADSRYAEAYFVAHTIYQQVALGKYRYRDFLVLAPDLNEYETYLTPILRQNKIPFFNDLQQQMKYHPLVIAIEALNDLLKRPFSTNNMLTIMKTCLFIPDWYHSESEYIHDLDQLENFVLAHGINYSLWERPFANFVDAQVIRIDKQEKTIAKIDQLRSYFVDRIDNILQKLQAEKDNQKAITAFFEFLTDNGVPKQLDNWRQAASESGDLQAAQQPEQLWSLLLQLLQDYLLVNNEEFDLANFFDVLINGFKEANFAQIPSTLDAVNLSEMGMVQNDSYKQVFIIGATNNNLPQIDNTPGFLTSENLEQLNVNNPDDSYLEDHQLVNNLDQEYQFGRKLALAHDRIYISYPVLNTNNEQLLSSIYYQRLQAFVSKEFIQRDLPHSTNDVLSFITNPEASLGYFSFINDQNLHDNLLALTNKYLPTETDQVVKATEYDNIPENIGPDLAEQLYGNELNSSVSQLETYYENSFEYFLNYGLQLRPRFENQLGVVEAGNYFHETFDRLVKLLHERKLDLADISLEQLQELLLNVREVMRDEGRYRQLLNDPFNKFLFAGLDETTNVVAFNWKKSLTETPLRAQYSELSFGQHEKLKGLSFDLPGNKKVSLRGKIDRVDLAPVSNHVLGQVIDYKSSEHKFDLGLFDNGIALQMVSYLDVLTKNDRFFSKNERLALLGAFYQTVTRKVERLNSTTTFNSNLEIKPGIESAKAKLLYSGILVDDPELLREADPLLADGVSKSSLYKSLSVKKNGDFTLPKNVNFNEEQLQLLLRYDEYLIKHAANKILTGDIELNPYKQNNRTALQYSNYKDIFFFDAKLPQNKYHLIDSIDKNELLKHIRAVLEEGEQNG